ncbi:uncharacterized protein [Taeniopygia guttata]|uniref:uncharacterized protein n=1 Tax=Taeniopygia guttata TaxID=59729 RepID=UPI003BB923A0
MMCEAGALRASRARICHPRILSRLLRPSPRGSGLCHSTGLILPFPKSRRAGEAAAPAGCAAGAGEGFARDPVPAGRCCRGMGSPRARIAPSEATVAGVTSSRTGQPGRSRARRWHGSSGAMCAGQRRAKSGAGQEETHGGNVDPQGCSTDPLPASPQGCSYRKHASRGMRRSREDSGRSPRGRPGHSRMFRNRSKRPGSSCAPARDGNPGNPGNAVIYGSWSPLLRGSSLAPAFLTQLRKGVARGKAETEFSPQNTGKEKLGGMPGVMRRGLPRPWVRPGEEEQEFPPGPLPISLLFPSHSIRRGRKSHVWLTGKPQVYLQGFIPHGFGHHGWDIARPSAAGQG